MRKRRAILFGALLLVLAAAVQAADFLYIPWLDAYADRSRLFLRWGFYGENIALQVSFGDSAIGLQFNETADDAGKINAARMKLLRILTTSNFNLDDLPRNLGLTFIQFVKYENVIPTVLR
jgi:hypothetical protein